MAFQHGKGSKFKLNSSELQTFLTGISLSQEKDLAETTTMGDSARDFIEGLYNATITLNLRWDPTASTGPDAIVNTAFVSASAVAWKFNPTGTATFSASAPGYTGNCWVRRVTRDDPYDDLVTMTVELQVDGAITRDTSNSY